MTALAFLLTAGWRPERSVRPRDWRTWVWAAAFYGLAAAIVAREGM